jgi:hypothetical protein
MSLPSDFMTALQQQLCETSHYDSLCNGPGVKRKVFVTDCLLTCYVADVFG